MSIHQIKNNFLSTKKWSRIMIMLLYAVVITVSSILLKVTIVVQTIFYFIASYPNKNIQQFNNYLNYYIYQMVCYLTYTSDHKPFPFSKLSQNYNKLDEDYVDENNKNDNNAAEDTYVDSVDNKSE